MVYAIHLYFDGLSLRNTSKALSGFVKRSHTAIRDWIQKYKPERLFYRKVSVAEFIVDETQIKVGSELIWLWIAIDPKNREILALCISKERNMFVAERFLSSIVKEYGRHQVSTYGGTWHPKAYTFLKAGHHIHSPFESVNERNIQYIRDRIEGFDDYFTCKKCNRELKRVKK